MDRSLRNRWQPVTKHYPPKDNDPMYEDRFSVPVLVGNENTSQVDCIAYVWDYDLLEWVYYTLDDTEEIEMTVTHWALWPKCKLVTLD